MKQKLITVPILALAVLMYACNDTAKPQNTVNEVLDLFVSSVNDKNLEPLNAIFSPKAKIYEQGSVDDSWEQYRDGHLGKEIEEMENIAFSIDITDFLVNKEMALLRGKYLIKGENKDQPINSPGLITISMQVEDGMWKIVHLQFSRECKKVTTDHSAHTEESDGKPKPKSPKTAAMGNAGNVHVHIEYSSPSVRGRTIWGGLIEYNKVWATGAHRATTINFAEDVEINDTKVPAGKYGFFTIPGEKEWTLIINENWDQHMSDDYNPSLDVVRIKVKPEVLSENQESLKYAVTELNNSQAEVSMAWEKLKVAFKVKGL
jgi:hypothetical protein